MIHCTIISYLWLLVWRLNPNAHKELSASPCLNVKPLGWDKCMRGSEISLYPYSFPTLAFPTSAVLPLQPQFPCLLSVTFHNSLKWMDCCLKRTEILAAKIPLRSWASEEGLATLCCPFLLPLCFCLGRRETTAHNGQLFRDLEELHLNTLHF